MGVLGRAGRSAAQGLGSLVPTIPAQGVERRGSSETTVPKILAKGGMWLRVPAPRVREASRWTQPEPWVSGAGPELALLA